MTQEILVLGGGATGLEVASELAADGQEVALVDEDTTVGRAGTGDATGSDSVSAAVDPTDDRTASLVVVATSCDARNLLLGARAPRAFDAERVVALVNDPDRRTAFEAADMETVCVSGAIARATADTVTPERPEQSNRPDRRHERAKVEG